MATTPNLGLHKPARTDLVSVVTDINNNMDTLDSKIGAVPAGHDVEEQITTLSDQIGTLNGNLANIAKWSNVTLTALHGSFANSPVCKKNGNMVFASVELNGPITAYQSIISGFPNIAGMYFGEVIDSAAEVRIRFYIQADGQWFFRADLPEGKTVRTSVMIALNV